MSTSTAPRQPQAALRRANKYRVAAAKFKKEVREYPMAEGCAAVADLLENPEVPQTLGHMRISAILAAPNRMGRDRATRTLRHAGITPARDEARLDRLTAGERLRLAGAMRERAKAA